MNRRISNEIHITKYHGFTPLLLGSGNVKRSFNLSGVYFKYTNWSFQMRRDVEGVATGNSNSVAYGCFSGAAKIIWMGATIIDARNQSILAIPVTDHYGHTIYMVSDMFDSPKGNTVYKSFRKHWRVTMYSLIYSGIKIVKVPNSFIQKFGVTFNYVPRRNEMARINREIFDKIKTMNV